MKKNRTIGLLCTGFMLSGGLIFSGCANSSEISSISVTTLPTTEYVIGNYLNLTGGKFTAVQKNGKRVEYELALAAVNVDKLDTVGEKTVTVTYANRTSTFKILVKKAKFDVVVPDINTTYNGMAQPVNISTLSDQVMLGPGMEIEKVTYRKIGTDSFIEEAPQNIGSYEIKLHISGGEKYEDCDAIAKYSIQKANFDGYKNGNVFQYAKNVYMEYGTKFNIKNLWLNNRTRSESFNYDLNYDWGNSIPYGEISLSNDDLANGDNLIVNYSIFKEDATQPGVFSEQVFSISTEDNEQKSDDEIEQFVGTLDVGNYIIKTNCQATSRNFNNYSQTTNLSIKKKQLVLTQDFNVNITYKNSTQETVNPQLSLTASSADYAGVFEDCLSDFEFSLVPNNLLLDNSVLANYRLEFSEFHGEGIALGASSVVSAVNKSGVYTLCLNVDSKNFYFSGNIMFKVKFVGE